MTYFGFLARYVVLPTLVFRVLNALDETRERRLPADLQNLPPMTISAVHSAIALAYTTIWDNYLVATRVWWYDKKRVSGLVLGWVPIEEYTFFVLQPLLTGSWWAWVARRIHAGSKPDSEGSQRAGTGARAALTALVGAGWFASLVGLASRSGPATYLSLLFSWALPPLMLQTAFGGDILWRRRGLVLAAFVPSTLYLSAADRLAIGSGNWTINPEKTVGIHLLGKLPLEEFLFFLMTNVLISSGITLAMDATSLDRGTRYMAKAAHMIRRAVSWLRRRVGQTRPQ